jgi:sec-independent protein translocase protein TatA
MAPSFLQITIVVVLILLLFGRGKISGLMGELAQGIKGFKKGMSEDDKQIEGAVSQSVGDEQAATGAVAPDESAGKNTASNG